MSAEPPLSSVASPFVQRKSHQRQLSCLLVHAKRVPLAARSWRQTANVIKQTLIPARCGARGQTPPRSVERLTAGRGDDPRQVSPPPARAWRQARPRASSRPTTVPGSPRIRWVVESVASLILGLWSTMRKGTSRGLRNDIWRTHSKLSSCPHHDRMSGRWNEA